VHKQKATSIVVKINNTVQTRNSAVSEIPRHACCHWIFC